MKVADGKVGKMVAVGQRQSQAGEVVAGEQGEVVTVKVTSQQEALLFEALSRTEGALNFVLVGGRVVSGTPGELGEVCYRLANLVAVDRAIGRVSQARKFESVLRRFEKAGIVPVQSEARVKAVSEKAQREIKVVVAPERRLEVKLGDPVSKAGARKYARRDALLASGDEARAEVGWEVTVLRRGRAKGREASKRAWSAKVQPRETKSRGMVRGDGVFRHAEQMVGKQPDEMTVERVDGEWLSYNKESVGWMRAGTERRSRSAGKALTAAGRRKAEAQLASQKLAVRVERMVEARRQSGKRVVPSVIAHELVREDVRAGKFVTGSGRAQYAYRRYSSAVPKLIKPVAGKPVRRVQTATEKGVQAAARRQTVVRIKERHEHEWAVSPKRVKRSCECGAVQRKVRGRWVAVVAQAEAVKRTRTGERVVVRRKSARSEATIRKLMSLKRISREQAVAAERSLRTF